jgi:phosphoesterase RecJ-like protein
MVKVSFRSKGRVDVAKIAGIFQGGGHRNAAGCTISGSLAEVMGKVLAEVRSTLHAEGWVHCG